MVNFVNFKKFNNIIYHSLIFFQLFINIDTYIVLPFKIYSPKNSDNITKIFNELLDNKLIITLPLGNPQKTMDFYASMNEYIYYLEEGSCNRDYTLSSLYNYNNSKTFNGSQKYNFCVVGINICHLGTDSIYLYDNINLKSTKEMDLVFYYGYRHDNINKFNGELCGRLGFKLGNSPYRFYDYENFMTILKNNKIINSGSWYIHYFNDNKNGFNGAIVIDIFNPKFFNDFPFLKKEDDYNTVYVRDSENILSWTFNFDKVYYTYNDTKIDIQAWNAGLAFETDFIHCPEAYYDSIKRYYFNELFNNNICFLTKGNYYYIYCDKKSFDKYKDQFPPISFISFGLNKTYILNSDELFRDIGNYYFFMVIKAKYALRYWTLGKLFFKKDNFYFDSNKNYLGYFKTNNIQNEKKSERNIFDKIKWYIFIIIGIIIGIVIGSKIREKARKLRANELEDNYEYLENKANSMNGIIDEDNSDNNVNFDSKKISNYKEIKSQLYEINDKKNI